jgi:hypothetical protein
MMRHRASFAFWMKIGWFLEPPRVSYAILTAIQMSPTPQDNQTYLASESSLTDFGIFLQFR